MNRKIINTLFLILAFILINAQTVYAENVNPLKITNLEAGIMPEYDTSDVLVIYALNYINTSGQSFSGEVRFQVSKGTTNNIVKETSTNNDNHIVVRVEDKGEYAEFVWKPTQSIPPNGTYPIHLEYYYNPLPGTGLKSFNYQFKTTIPIEQAKFNISQPLKATDFKMEPAGQLLGKDNQGFQVYEINSSKMNSGDKVDFKISYTKNDPKPSVQPPTGTGSTTGQTGLTGQTGSSQWRSAAVIIPLVVLIAVIVVVIVKARNNFESDDEEDYEEPPKKTNNKLAEEKRKLRKMLLDGRITESTYHELLVEIESEDS